jgi:hypothetical protein
MANIEIEERDDGELYLVLSKEEYDTVPNLKKLLNDMNDENLHAWIETRHEEIDFGPPVGKEIIDDGGWPFDELPVSQTFPSTPEQHPHGSSKRR